MSLGQYSAEGDAMRRLSGWDAYMLYSETPTVHNHTLKVAVVDSDESGQSLTFDAFRATLAAYLPSLEPLRFLLVKVPAGLHHPMWRENYPVDLDRHLFEVTAMSPGARAELDSVVGDIASTPLDRDLPLWSFHFVSGLANGRVAIVAKVHHALADGIASANLMARAVTRSPGAATGPDQSQSDPDPSGSDIVRAALRDYRTSAALLPRVVGQTLSGLGRSLRRAERAPAQDARMMRAPATFFNGTLSTERAFGTATIDLGAVKALSKTLAVTVNDVVLALAAGALRDGFKAAGQEPVAVVGAVAVATNRDPNRIYGNHLAAMMTSLPCDEADPVARCRRVKASTAAAKHNLELLGLQLVEQWMEFIWPKTSSKIFQTMSSRTVARNRMVNLPISNVPGPRETGFVAGFPMAELYSVGPLYDRCGLNITVWSYVDQLNVSVLSDPTLVPAPERFANLMAVELKNLGAAVRKEAR